MNAGDVEKEVIVLYLQQPLEMAFLSGIHYAEQIIISGSFQYVCLLEVLWPIYGCDSVLWKCRHLHWKLSVVGINKLGAFLDVRLLDKNASFTITACMYNIIIHTQ